MEKFPKQYNRENMKMAMLKHEETFRHQVHELHRLYRIQKILMNEMKAELVKQKASSNSQRNMERRIRQPLDLELPAEEFNGEGEGDGALKDEEEEGELELTLATGSRIRKKDETSFTSDSGASFSWSSAESAQLSRFLSEGKGAFDADEQLSRNRMNQPPWLLQCLSLNMTR